MIERRDNRLHKHTVDRQGEQGSVQPFYPADADPRRFSEASFRRLWSRSDLTAERIGVLMGVAPATVLRRAKALNLPSKSAGHRVDVDDEALREMWGLGVRSGDIGAALGVSQAYVSRRVKKLGLPHRRPGARSRMTLSAYRETLLAKAMAETAVREQAQFKLAEMVDHRGTHTSGKRKAA